MNTRIWATFEKSFDIGCSVIKWDEPGGFNFIPYKKYSRRGGMSFEDLSKALTQFTVHWSVTYRAKHMFSGLNVRGLSCNFMIDDDRNLNGYATIYQCLPIMYAGWSQGSYKRKSFNGLGPGVEISYMPQAWQEDMYDANDQRKWKVPPHDVMVAPIHGTKMRVHLPTKAQMNSLKALIWGYCELFPRVPAQFPKKNGSYITTKLSNAHDYIGLVNHYHLRRDKPDAAGLDMEDVEKEVNQRLIFGY